MHVWHSDRLDGPRLVINFPTKGHWRSKSKLANIEAGLDDLVEVIAKLEIRSIAVPPLGCGHGGLDWAEVEPLIRQKLDLPHVDVHLFSPPGAPAAADMRIGGEAPTMTAGRAALIELLRGYESRAVEGTSQIEVQTLMYFLQVAGEPLRLRYVNHFYGPYADNLRHVLHDLEGHHLLGFGDGSKRVAFADPIKVLPAASTAAEAVMKEHPDTQARIEQVMNLVEGYESAYSLELLATVHWVMTHEPHTANDVSALMRLVHKWSPRKERMFAERHIATAWETLRDRGWLPEQVTV
jgi:O-acetyl-ADP-ribose deacetylase (regulator of RNase III)